MNISKKKIIIYLLSVLYLSSNAQKPIESLNLEKLNLKPIYFF